MSVRRHHAWLATGAPLLAGIGLLAGGVMLLPDRIEVLHAQRRALPAKASAPSPMPVAEPIAPQPVAPLPAPPSIAAAIPTADATTLAALTERLLAEGQPVTTLQVAYDLAAAKRFAVALAYLAARPDGTSPATWRLRVDLLRRVGRTDAAAALVADAAAARGAAVADLIDAAYALQRPDLIVVAAARRVIPPPDAALALDLARHADKAGRSDLIAMLDTATSADWRARDPWLAIRVAMRAKDTAAALRAVDRLPGNREAAREAILTSAGHRDGLRRLWLAQAGGGTTAPGLIAERLLAAGYREDAMAVLRRAAADFPVTDPAAQRLLYLMGPRPTATDLAWLRQRALRGSAAEQARWIDIYSQHDRPAEALAFVSRHPLAERTDVMLTRLSLARAAGNAAAARGLASALLDGRTLDPDQVQKLSATAPADRGQATAIARRRIAAGVATPRDAIDLAWAAWNAGDAAGAARWLRGHLAAHPGDLAALRLMADAEARTGGAAAARPWLERALAQTPPDSRARAELLDRLGRRAEAIGLVQDLRAVAPQDRALAALHARLLIAQGQPGRARTVLAR